MEQTPISRDVFEQRMERILRIAEKLIHYHFGRLDEATFVNPGTVAAARAYAAAKDIDERLYKEELLERLQWEQAQREWLGDIRPKAGSDDA